MVADQPVRKGKTLITTEICTQLFSSGDRVSWAWREDHRKFCFFFFPGNDANGHHEPYLGLGLSDQLKYCLVTGAFQLYDAALMTSSKAALWCALRPCYGWLVLVLYLCYSLRARLISISPSLFGSCHHHPSLLLPFISDLPFSDQNTKHYGKKPVCSLLQQTSSIVKNQLLNK